MFYPSHYSPVFFKPKCPHTLALKADGTQFSTIFACARFGDDTFWYWQAHLQEWRRRFFDTHRDLTGIRSTFQILRHFKHVSNGGGAFNTLFWKKKRLLRSAVSILLHCLRLSCVRITGSCFTTGFCPLSISSMLWTRCRRTTTTWPRPCPH